MVQDPLEIEALPATMPSETFTPTRVCWVTMLPPATASAAESPPVEPTEMKLAEPVAALVMAAPTPTTSVPERIDVPPSEVIGPASVSVPAPCFVTLPAPLMVPEWVKAFERLKTSVPLLTRLPVPPRSTPVAPPVPIWSVPPALRLIVPEAPRESVRATDTKPPLIVSVAGPAEPTDMSPPVAHVPSVTVAVPAPPAFTPR